MTAAEEWAGPVITGPGVRNLAAVLRAIADESGQSVHDLAAAMPYGRAAITESLTGVLRPEWDFVVAFLRACTGRDCSTLQVLVRRARSLWEAAGTGTALGPGEVDFAVETRAWMATLHEILTSEHIYAWGDVSVTRHTDIAASLATMLQRSAEAVTLLSAEADVLRADETALDDGRLADVRGRLAAAEQVHGQVAHRLNMALRQRCEAERLQQDALARLEKARGRNFAVDHAGTGGADELVPPQSPDPGSAQATMGPADQWFAAELLRRVDVALQQEAVALCQLRAELPWEPALADEPRAGLTPPRPRPISPPAWSADHPRTRYGAWTRPEDA